MFASKPRYLWSCVFPDVANVRPRLINKSHSADNSTIHWLRTGEVPDGTSIASRSPVPAELRGQAPEPAQGVNLDLLTSAIQWQ